MSGSLPTTPKARSASISAYRSNRRSESLSGIQKVRTIEAHRWDITLKYPMLNRAEFATIDGFLESQEGGVESFTVVLPVLSTSIGSVSGTITTNAAGSIGDKSIAVDGFTGTLKAGDFFKFANHNKVYKCVEDRAGAGALSFRPGLIFAVSDNEAITHDNVPFTVRQSNDVHQYDTDYTGLFEYELDLIEAL